MVVDPLSFGGWQMGWYELHLQGLFPDRDVQFSFAGKHDAVVYAVESGEADVGSVRSDTLERMAQEGLIKLSKNV